MNHKLSKFFRIGVEGATTDGRNIDRNWLVQMAKNFNPIKYGARIWLEHIRGILPDSPFKAYGDVVALKAEEWEIDGETKMALFAQIRPKPELVALSKSGDKIYASMEITPNFAKTGEAYLTGMGITDSPASLGTEVLAFAAQNQENNPFGKRKSNPDALFSEAVEITLDFDEEEPENSVPTLLDRVKALIAKFSGKEAVDNAPLNDIAEATTLLLSHVDSQSEKLEQAFTYIDELKKQLEAQQAAFSELAHQLESTPGAQPERPEATGGTGELQTDC